MYYIEIQTHYTCEVQSGSNAKRAVVAKTLQRSEPPFLVSPRKKDYKKTPRESDAERMPRCEQGKHLMRHPVQ